MTSYKTQSKNHQPTIPRLVTRWSRDFKVPCIFLLCLISITSLYAQVIIEANGPGETYELINSHLGGNAIENPECIHPEFGRHITEAWDDDLGKYVFVFHSHVTPDNDRCVNFDRQRIEIKTYGPSPAHVKGSKGEVHTYRWKFKLDAGFQPSSSFTHIHQIKAGDGSDAGAPLITITPRAGTPQRLQIIFTPSSGQSGGGTVASADLANFKGVWVEVYERVLYEENGTYELNISRVSDGASLLSYSNNNIDMWRGDATFNRPKWGIYRSLNNAASLRDEQVLFADFCIAEGDAVCPGPPTVNIVAPANQSVFEAGTIVPITAEAFDDGSVTKVEFFVDGEKIGEDVTAPYAIGWTAVEGTHAVFAKATDNSGNTRFSPSVQILVNPEGAPAVQITSPAAGSNFITPTSITIETMVTGTTQEIAKVEFFSNGSKIGEVATSPYNFTWANVSAGNYLLQAKATDGLGVVGASSFVSVTVSNNTPPDVGIASPSQGSIIMGTDSLTIEAFATDSDGDVVKVEFFSGNLKIGEVQEAPFTMSWKDMLPGTYILTAKATDDLGAVVVSSPITITIVADGTEVLTFPPIHDSFVRGGSSADANYGVPGCNCTANPPEYTQLIVKIQGTNLSNSREAYLTFDVDPSLFTGDVANVLLKLYGKIDDTRARNVPISLHAVANTTWTESTITWNNKPPSSDSPLTTTAVANDEGQFYLWDITDYVNGELSAGRTTISFALKSQLSTDPQIRFNSKENGTNPPQLLVLTSGNTQAPVVAITSPENGNNFIAPAEITINAEVSDEPDIVLVEFFSNGIKIGEVADSPYAFTWADVSAGNYALQAKATNSLGVAGISALVEVTVNENVFPEVSIISLSTGDVIVASGAVSIEASASDSDGEIVKVEFFAGELKIGEAQHSPYSISWTGMLPGKYSLVARATDDAGGVTTSASVTVVIASERNEIFTLAPTHDSFVRGGGSANANYGVPGCNCTANPPEYTQLIVKIQGTNLSNSREAYLTFDIDAPAQLEGEVSTVLLKLYGKLDDNRDMNAPITIHPVADTDWSEITITWNTKPVADAPLDTATVGDNVGRFYLWDLTSYVKSEIAAGHARVSFALQSQKSTNPQIRFNSKENSINPPELIVLMKKTVVTITSPIEGATVVAPASVTINASTITSDANATISKVEFFANGEKLGEDSTPPYSFSWTNAQPGTYTLEAKATDSDGVTGTDVVTITVKPGQISLVPIHDAYVRNGAHSKTAFGTVDPAALITHANPASTSESYLMFNVSNAEDEIASAVLRVYGAPESSITNSIPVGLFTVKDTKWDELEITWRDKPVTSASFVTADVDHAGYYEWDATKFLTKEVSKGHANVAFAIKNLLASSPAVVWNSKEAGNNPPQLLITFVPTSLGMEENLGVNADENNDSSNALSIVSVYPNPFSDHINIELNVKEAGVTKLLVYNKLGIKVAVLADQYLDQGTHQFNLESNHLPIDVYVLKLVHNGESVTRMLLKN